MSRSRLVEVSEHFDRGRELLHGWEWLSCSAGSFAAPSELTNARFAGARAPSTVAGEVRALGELRRDVPPDLDGQDHWYRVCFGADEVQGRRLLVFDGLASLATVWLNGVRVLDAENMYRRYAIEVDDLLVAHNELVIRFAALAPELKRRKGRRRWPTRLVNQRNLRFVRTTLLGRMPGWTPPWPVVGPYRAVRLVTAVGPTLRALRCVPSVDERGARVDLEVLVDDARDIGDATFCVGESRVSVEFVQMGDGYCGRATLRLEQVNLWWPHTHGAQPLYEGVLNLRYAGALRQFRVPGLGFRSLRLLPPEQFGFEVNGEEIFCRGACWTPLDVVTLASSEQSLRQALEQVRDAGMNMLRVSGVTQYEEPAFHRLCDELGILVWQDFMFANMDYPREDEHFEREVRAEVSQVLERVGCRCSTVLLCGGSETEQQAAMMGLPAEDWHHPLWRELLPDMVAHLCPQVPYWYASPGGEGLPFWPHHGCTHYYGVGAYLRGPNDARVTDPRFASECLAFASPPDEGAELGSGPAPLGLVPKDNGAKWDFGDVTDHYVGLVHGAGARRCQSQQYLAHARSAIADTIYQAQTHFRDPDTACRGSIVWLLRDLEPGSGWGLIDSSGRPKSGFRALQRIWASRAAWLVDEGLSGLSIVVVNELPAPMKAVVRLALRTVAGAVSDEWTESVELAGRSHWRKRVEVIAGRFLDSTYAYRFGPPAYDHVQLTLTVDGEVIAEERRGQRPTSQADDPW